jgi:hypothetical protein
MHYGDEEWVRYNKLELMVYKHEDLTDNKNDNLVEITSVRSCRQWPAYLTCEVLHGCKFMFKDQFKSMDYDEWYMLTVRLDKDMNYIVDSLVKIEADDKDDTKRLH